MSGSAADPLNGGRLQGLDTWRALLMLGGLVVHGSVWREPLPLFDAIVLVSHSFRMGSFFAISGFLCGVSIVKRPPGQWLTRRLVQIGLPTLFGLVVICPLIDVIISLRPPHAQGSVPPPLDWHHLWFLVALLVYSPIAVLADRFDRRHRLVERLTASFCTPRRSLLPLLLATSGMSLVLMIAAALLVDAFAPAAYRPMLSQCRMIAGYLPLYLLGLALARSSELRCAACRSLLSPLVVVALTEALYLAWYALLAPGLAAGDRAWIDQFVQLAGAALCPPAVFLLIFHSAAAIRRTPPMLARLRDASLTIYLVHLPVIVAINLMFAELAWNPYLEFATGIVVSGLVSYAIHALVVRRVPLLALLVNGRSDELRLPTCASVDEARHYLAIGTADLHLRT